MLNKDQTLPLKSVLCLIDLLEQKTPHGQKAALQEGVERSASRRSALDHPAAEVPVRGCSLCLTGLYASPIVSAPNENEGNYRSPRLVFPPK